MPTYELPPIKKESAEEDVPMESTEFPSRWEREIRLPVNSEIIRSLSTGDDAEVMLKGRVSELIDHQHEDGKRDEKMVVIELAEISVYSDEEAMERGFKKGPRQLRGDY